MRPNCGVGQRRSWTLKDVQLGRRRLDVDRPNWVVTNQTIDNNQQSRPFSNRSMTNFCTCIALLNERLWLMHWWEGRGRGVIIMKLADDYSEASSHSQLDLTRMIKK